MLIGVASHARGAPRTKGGSFLTRPVETRSRPHLPARLCLAALIGAMVLGTGLGASWSQPLDPAGARGSAPDSAAAAACTIARKNRVYVALADGVDLEDYERAAGAAQSIMSVVKAGLCTVGSKGRRQLLTPTLRRALEAGRRVELEEVQFDDQALAHARVLLRSSSAIQPATTDHAWRVHVHREAGWQIDTVRDEPAKH